jgi:hypothetical protein
MEKNNFICELDLKLDINYLKEMVLEKQDANFKLAPHHRLVKNDSYLTKIKNQFPFLSPIFNVYKFPSGKGLPVHIDGDRFCSINIPIYNTENSNTIFYDMDNNSRLEYDEQRILHYVKGSATEAFRFTLTRPTLINNTKPHSVMNNSLDTRIIISWSILKPMTFEECILCLQ